MTKREDIPWKRLTAEAIAIVLSILLAFWIDAWWDSRSEGLDEVEVLSLLREEVRSFRRTLELEDRRNNAIFESAKSLLIESSNENVNFSQSEMDALLYDVSWFQVPSRLRLPVLESLRQSGRISAISNNEIRRRLDSWDSRIQTLRDSYVRDLEFCDNYLIPFFLKHVSLPQVYLSFQSVPGNPAGTFSGFDITWSKRIDHRPLLEEREFQNIIQERLSRLNDIVVYRPEGIDADSAEILQLIDTDLSERQ